MNWPDCPDMNIAVDWDIKHQTNTLLCYILMERINIKHIDCIYSAGGYKIFTPICPSIDMTFESKVKVDYA